MGSECQIRSTSRWFPCSGAREPPEHGFGKDRRRAEPSERLNRVRIPPRQHDDQSGALTDSCDGERFQSGVGIASRRCMHRMPFTSGLRETLCMLNLYARARSLAALLPRPLRFLAVGGLGLATNIAVFTIVWMLGVPSLTAGLLALVAATILTWRLNRALTFQRSGRRPHRAKRCAMPWSPRPRRARATRSLPALTLTLLAEPAAGRDRAGRRVWARSFPTTVIACSPLRR